MGAAAAANMDKPFSGIDIVRQEYVDNTMTLILIMLTQNASGKRFVHIRRRRRAHEYSRFMAALAAEYPEAEAIELVQDNLNIHDPASFYKVFDAQTALELSLRFVWHYTPTHASWLNMAELEFSAYARQCANQRWNGLNEFVSESLDYFQQRNSRNIKIRWKFTEYHARDVFKRHYEDIRIT